ncbi:MAG: DUF1501 domain-containing protein [Fuerstiella sp.]|jgi:hypothetical protein|nr:DUF1501 domain-containing protein [Fuerstiella sp.]
MMNDSVNRRRMLVASATGLATCSGMVPGTSCYAGSADTGRSPNTTTGGRAKSTILFFLCGGASQIDTWDMKPTAPAEYRGPFQPIATNAAEIQLCEHLPLLAQQARHLSLIRSVSGTVNTNDHHGGYYYNLTGHVPDPTFLTKGNDRTPYPDDWPFMGAVVASRRSRHAYLPNAMTLPHMPSRKPYTRPGQFSARLGVQYDPLYLQGSNEKPLSFSAPALELQAGTDTSRVASRAELLTALDDARRHFDKTATGIFTQQQQRAFSMLSSAQTTKAFDVSKEPVQCRQRYGETVNGMSLLLARRLVEVGVPFITVFWLGDGVGTPLAKKCRSAGSWDTHGSNFDCLKDDLLPEFDQCFSALVEDLDQRNLLDQTSLLVSSEMGRNPKIGDRRSGGVSGAGRDHWTHLLTNVVAGGGIQGGRIYGSSDRLGEYPAENPVTPAHVVHTVYHAMGVTNLEAEDTQGRPYQLLDAGEPLYELF